MRLEYLFLWVLVFCFGLQPLNAQSYKWAKSAGGDYQDIGLSITTDGEGNVYTTGEFEYTADFDPDTSTYNLVSQGDTDLFIYKLDASGNFVWAKQIGGTGSDSGRSITTDASGNIYVTGYFQETVDFDTGGGVFNLVSQGGTDSFICKLDTSGNFVWAINIGGTSRGFSIQTDSLGNVYTTGDFRNTVDFDPDTSTYNLSSAGSSDLFITKFDSLGGFIWVKQMTGPGDVVGFSLDLDGNGNIYTTGHFSGTVDFDPSFGIFNLTSYSSLPNKDVFISKLDASGNFIWVKHIGDSYGDDIGKSVSVDISGNVYTTGEFMDTVDFDPGPGIFNLVSSGYWDVFISKLDSSGNFVWAKQFGGTDYDYSNSIVTDNSGNVYTTGEFRNTVDFDPGADTFNLTAAGNEDIFINKLDPFGNFVWVQQVGSGYYDKGMAITTDSSGHIYTTGCFSNTVDFDPSAPVANETEVARKDLFVYKMYPCNTAVGTDTQSTCDSYTWIDGNTYYNSNNTSSFIYSGGSVSDCDSIVYLDLTITNKSTDTQTACDSYTWIDGNTYNSSNNTATHTYLGASVNGCDSIIALDLTINNSSTGSDVIAICDSYTWSADGQTYNQSGTYSTVLTNMAGCDSTVTLDLFITNSTSYIETVEACDSYMWSASGQTYTQSGNHTAVLTNAAGCDSTVTLNLTITNSSSSSETINTCDSYTWSADGQTYTQPGSYTTILTNAAGCDSTVTLDLTITNSNSSAETFSACDSYTWSANSQTYTQSGTYTTILTNAVGCDSIVTLNLTLDSVNTIITQVDDITLEADASNAQYQWVNCDQNYQVISGATNQTFEAATNGNYAAIVTENGCTDTTDCITIDKVGLKKITKQTLNVYPNPTTKTFMITSDITINSPFEIIDGQGKEVLTGNMNGKEHTIDISSLSNGVYSVVFDNAELPVLSVIKE